MLDKILVLIYLIGGALAISTMVTVGELGNVVGLKECSTFTNRPIYTFRGIPYAEAPIGDLRFRPPVRVTTWKGTLNATQFAKGCPANSAYISPVASVNEDCLTLNVYVPEVKTENPSLPVMIYIHGGTFTNEYPAQYQPHHLLEGDVILVTMAFRLGPLGLLCLQTDEVPGNVQFLDQIMAMQWVQDNIRYFGGNPDKVTLFGQSTGAATVNLHQMSPLSKGLFHQAILHSGSALGTWVMDYNPVDSATKFGGVVGCTQTNATELAACFKGLDVQTILDGFDKYLALYSLGGLSKIGGHRAVIQTAGTQKFLEADPSVLISSGKYNHMPMMGGTTKHEGSDGLEILYHSALLPLGLIKDKKFLTYDITNFLVTYTGIVDPTGGISNSLTRSHFEQNQLGNFTKMVPGLVDIIGVFIFKAPTLQMLQANSRVNTSYLYTFSYFGENGIMRALNLPFETGVAHSDELYYLFPWAPLSGHDVTIAKRMISLWTSFATTGVPSADGKSVEPMSNPFGPYLIIEDEFSDGHNYLSQYTIASDEGMTPFDRSLRSTSVKCISRNL